MLGSYIHPNGIEEELCKHIEGTLEADVKTDWMANGQGFAFKTGGNEAYPCFACDIKNRDGAAGTKNLCGKSCLEHGRDSQANWICYRRDMLTFEFLQKCRGDLALLRGVDEFVGQVDDFA